MQVYFCSVARVESISVFIVWGKHQFHTEKSIISKHFVFFFFFFGVSADLP